MERELGHVTGGPRYTTPSPGGARVRVEDGEGDVVMRAEKQKQENEHAQTRDRLQNM